MYIPEVKLENSGGEVVRGASEWSRFWMSERESEIQIHTFKVRQEFNIFRDRFRIEILLQAIFLFVNR